MVKAATSGQARALNATLISRIDEKALEQIDGTKLQQAINNPEGLIHNFIRFINNDCHFHTGPLVVNLDEKPLPGDEVKTTTYGPRITFNPEIIKLVKKHEIKEHLSVHEYRKRILRDGNLKLLNANILIFCENYQYDPLIAKFLEPYKKSNLYQFGTVYTLTGFRPDYITYLYWNGKCWQIERQVADDNYILQGYAFVISK